MDARSTALFKQDVVSRHARAADRAPHAALSAAGSQEATPGVDFFTAIKSMTITGYYTTEIGLQQELGDDGVLAQAELRGLHASGASEV